METTKARALLLDDATAIKLFNDKNSCRGLKDILITSFGIDFFQKKSGKIIEMVKTFDDAYSLVDKETRKEYDENSFTKSKDVIAYNKLKLIFKVINEGWTPDWNNTNQQKWYPYFNWVGGSGFGFSDSCYVYLYTCSNCGSRLCCETKEKAEYVGRQFCEIWNEFLN